MRYASGIGIVSTHHPTDSQQALVLLFFCSEHQIP
jgi:hypothetical protein